MFEQLIISCQHDDKLHQMLRYDNLWETPKCKRSQIVQNVQKYRIDKIMIISVEEGGKEEWKLPASSIAFSKSALTMDPFSGSRVLPAVPIPENQKKKKSSMKNTWSFRTNARLC